MEKVLVAGRALNRRAVLEAIRRAGVVHVEPVERREMIALPAVREELVLAGQAIDILEEITGAAAAYPPEHTNTVVIERVLALAAAREVNKARRQELLRERQQVAPWGLLGSGELRALVAAGLRVEFFTCPAGADGAVQSEIRHLASRTKDREYWVAVSRGEIVLAAPALRAAIPDRDAAAVDDALRALDAEQERLNRELAALKPCGDDLRQYGVRLRDQERLLEVESGLHDAGELFVLKGWLPSREARGLAEADVNKARGLAEAAVIEAQGTATAEAMRLKAEAFKQYNEAAIIELIMKVLPEIAGRISEPLSKMEKMVIINSGNGPGGGASKLTGDVTQIIAQLPPVIESLTGVKFERLLEQMPALKKAMGKDDSSQPSTKG